MSTRSASPSHAFVLEQQGQSGVLRPVQLHELPEGDVLLRVLYSSFNYKDGLAVAGRPGVVRHFPMVPGIDLVGEVLESASSEFTRGQTVLLTGWGVGEVHWGGFSQLARVNSAWLLPLPEGLSPQQSMLLGTAGLTAMLCLMALERHGLSPSGSEVVVSGASGGVGSVAVALLAHAGHRVTASTGRLEEEKYLHGLGASRLLHRSVLSGMKKPLESERFAAGIDTVGGRTLSGMLASLKTGGAVAACGLAESSTLETSVFPFILRGVALLGVESVRVPNAVRQQAWARLAREFPFERFVEGTQVHGLRDLPELAERILSGQVRGRVVIDVARGL